MYIRAISTLFSVTESAKYLLAQIIDKGGKLKYIKKILIYEMYSNKTNNCDICILKLNETLSFRIEVNNIVLKDKIII